MKLKSTGIKTLVLLLLLTIYSCGDKPETLYINGKIYTMDGSNSVAEAIAIRQGKILEVGSTKEITEKYSSDDVFDLKGAVVLPGFIDSEGSIIEFSKNLNYINLSYAKSLDEIKSLILEKARNTYEGEWIGGYGWNELNIPEEELVQMDKKFLDKIAPNYSVYLVNANLNTVLVNSRLMRTLGINKDTPAPAGGEIEKYSNGELTGVFYDEAVNLIRDNIPGLLKNEMQTQVEKGVKEIVKYGITEVHDKTLGKEGLEIFKALIDSNRFPLRVYAIISGEDSSMVDTYFNKGIETGYKDKLTVRAVSMDYDGLFEIQDAAMTEDYLADPKRKVPYVTEEDIERVYTRAIDKKFQFYIKAVGDRAVSSSLNVMDKVLKKTNAKDQRTVIEYCEFVTPKDLNKISELSLIPSVRPDVTMYDLQIVPQLINSEYGVKTGLWNSLLRSAGKITTGSDFPFHQINPFLQIYYLTTRQLTDTVLTSIPNPDQKISLLDAVKSYTIWPAYASFEENTKGSIEKGKFADFIVISKDIFNSDPKAMLETKVLRTVVNGRVAYDNIFDPEKL
ncbi:MAG: amidohydrolase [Ignavibacteria bacterium]|nr:amidohydrolase [Ignavibacteria bacterium]